MSTNDESIRSNKRCSLVYLSVFVGGVSKAKQCIFACASLEFRLGKLCNEAVKGIRLKAFEEQVSKNRLCA